MDVRIIMHARVFPEPELSTAVTMDDKSVDDMMLVISLSVVLGSIIVVIFILMCVIVGILKCPSKPHHEKSLDSDCIDEATTIETSSNICYGESSDQSHIPGQPEENRDSLHLYDDIIPSLETEYENVDIATGLPTAPKPASLREGDLTSSAPVCERACIPLKAITPMIGLPTALVLVSREQDPTSSAAKACLPLGNITRVASSNTLREVRQHSPGTKRDQSDSGRSCTFKYKFSSHPKREAVSAILTPAGYEMPKHHVKVTSL